MPPTHYTQLPHAHYLTFSCYRRLWLFKDHFLYQQFICNLDEVRTQLNFKLYGFVIMPNHVHLLIFPQPDSSMSQLLSLLKGRFAHQAIAHLKRNWPQVHSRLKIIHKRETSWRFWQAGGGYDRNVYSDDVFVQTLEYMHLNPVRKKLVQSALDWKWSSAAYYHNGQSDLIRIDPPDWK
jgi:putative transposase